MCLVAAVLGTILMRVSVPVCADTSIALRDLSIATEAGLRAAFSPAEGAHPARLEFTKTGPERRFVGFSGTLPGGLAGARTLRLRYRLAAEGVETLRVAALLFEGGGARWLKVGPPQAPEEGETTAVLSLGALNAAPFAEAGAAEPDFAGLRQVWVGVVLDGDLRGTLELLEAVLSDSRPSAVGPLRVTDNAPGSWELFSDPAAQATVDTVDDGPEGQRCMRLQFTFPGGRHMYANPHVALPLCEFEGYFALRFKYKATLPAGIGGLLVMVGEAGTAIYRADPPPPASAEWTELTVPFSRMKLGEWTRDDNGRLDLDALSTLYIGVHGTAAGDGGAGTVWATDIEFIP